MQSLKFKITRKSVAAVVATLFFSQSTFLLPLAEANLWQDRRRAVNVAQATQDSSEEFQQALENPDILLASLPKVESGLALPISNRALSDLGISVDLHTDKKASLANKYVPEWLQRSIAPYATIHQIHLSKNPNAKTILLMQDAHMHYEAQLNAAGSIDALARALKDQKSHLLVGLEGTEIDRIDFSAYTTYPRRDIMRKVAKAMLKANIIDGTEYAAIGYLGDNNGQGPVTLPFEVTGVENKTEHEANIKALREALPIRDMSKQALSDLKRELVDLRKKHYNEELYKFDSKLTAFEEGALGVPEYVLYLDSIVSGTTHNLKELISAALLEGSIDFAKVESERTKILETLLAKISEEETKTLLQYSTLFKAGEVSYAGYYSHLRKLCKKHGVDFNQYTEMGLYIQYVLKTESIDHNQLFDDIKTLEEAVQAKLATSREQKDVANLSKEYYLLKKLSEHILTEDEWHTYEARRDAVHNMASRFQSLGAKLPSSLAKMESNWGVFEDFYKVAVARNKTLSERMAQRLNADSTKYGVLIAGGFHTQGILEQFKKQNVNVLVTSPKITELEEGISSLDVLASGRTPLDQLFVGERLFVKGTVGAGNPAMVPGFNMPQSEAQSAYARAAANALGADEDTGQRATGVDGRVEVETVSADSSRARVPIPGDARAFGAPRILEGQAAEPQNQTAAMGWRRFFRTAGVFLIQLVPAAFVAMGLMGFTIGAIIGFALVAGAVAMIAASVVALREEAAHFREAGGFREGKTRGWWIFFTQAMDYRNLQVRVGVQDPLGRIQVLSAGLTAYRSSAKWTVIALALLGLSGFAVDPWIGLLSIVIEGVVVYFMLGALRSLEASSQDQAEITALEAKIAEQEEKLKAQAAAEKEAEAQAGDQKVQKGQTKAKEANKVPGAGAGAGMPNIINTFIQANVNYARELIRRAARRQVPTVYISDMSEFWQLVLNLASNLVTESPRRRDRIIRDILMEINAQGSREFVTNLMARQDGRPSNLDVARQALLAHDQSINWVLANDVFRRGTNQQRQLFLLGWLLANKHDPEALADFRKLLEGKESATRDFRGEVRENVAKPLASIRFAISGLTPRNPDRLNIIQIIEVVQNGMAALKKAREDMRALVANELIALQAEVAAIAKGERNGARANGRFFINFIDRLSGLIGKRLAEIKLPKEGRYLAGYREQLNDIVKELNDSLDLFISDVLSDRYHAAYTRERDAILVRLSAGAAQWIVANFGRAGAEKEFEAVTEMRRIQTEIEKVREKVAADKAAKEAAAKKSAEAERSAPPPIVTEPIKEEEVALRAPDLAPTTDPGATIVGTSLSPASSEMDRYVAEAEAIVRGGGKGKLERLKLLLNDARGVPIPGFDRALRAILEDRGIIRSNRRRVAEKKAPKPASDDAAPIPLDEPLVTALNAGTPVGILRPIARAALTQNRTGSLRATVQANLRAMARRAASEARNQPPFVAKALEVFAAQLNAMAERPYVKLSEVLVDFTKYVIPGFAAVRPIADIVLEASGERVLAPEAAASHPISKAFEQIKALFGDTLPAPLRNAQLILTTNRNPNSSVAFVTADGRVYVNTGFFDQTAQDLAAQAAVNGDALEDSPEVIQAHLAALHETVHLLGIDRTAAESKLAEAELVTIARQRELAAQDRREGRNPRPIVAPTSVAEVTARFIRLVKQEKPVAADQIEKTFLNQTDNRFDTVEAYLNYQESVRIIATDTVDRVLRAKVASPARRQNLTHRIGSDGRLVGSLADRASTPAQKAEAQNRRAKEAAQARADMGKGGTNVRVTLLNDDFGPRREQPAAKGTTLNVLDPVSVDLNSIQAALQHAKQNNNVLIVPMDEDDFIAEINKKGAPGDPTAQQQAETVLALLRQPGLNIEYRPELSATFSIDDPAALLDPAVFVRTLEQLVETAAKNGITVSSVRVFTFRFDLSVLRSADLPQVLQNIAISVVTVTLYEAAERFREQGGVQGVAERFKGEKAMVELSL